MAWLLCTMLLIVCCSYGSSKHVEGEVYTTTGWAFVTRFVFSDTNGGLEYSIKYPCTYKCGPKMVFYYKDNWSRVYPGTRKHCSYKMEFAFNSYEADKFLNTSYEHVHCTNQTQPCHCHGKINFLAMSDRWWFLVLSQCHTNEPLDANFKFTITDGTSWENQVSADESDLFIFTAICLLIFSAMLIISVVYYHHLVKIKFLHIPYKIFMVGLAYEEGALVLELCYYLNYIERGKQLIVIKTIGSFLHSASETVFMVLLIVMAKGFTVTRGRLPKFTLVRLGIFAALYGISYVTSIVMELEVTKDPRWLRNSLDDGAEIGVMVFTMMAWAWFLYGVIQTIDKYPEKLVFYSWFCVIYSVWFLAKPGVTIFTRFMLVDWRVQKVNKQINLAICILGYVVFLQLTRPTASNRNFPFHVRTNQIGIIELNENGGFPHTEEYSRLKKEAKRELETSLTNLQKTDNKDTSKKQGVVSVWFSGKH